MATTAVVADVPLTSRRTTEEEEAVVAGTPHRRTIHTTEEVLVAVRTVLDPIRSTTDQLAAGRTAPRLTPRTMRTVVAVPAARLLTRVRRGP